MLDAPTKQREQLWIVERLYRICTVVRNNAAGEPCLEQYEQQVRLIMDEEVTPAAAAWIQVIVQSLRQGTAFCAEDYLR